MNNIFLINKDLKKYQILFTYYDKDDNIKYKVLGKIFNSITDAQQYGDKYIWNMKYNHKDYKNFNIFICNKNIPRKYTNKLVSMMAVKENEIYIEKWNIIRKDKKYTINEVLDKYGEKLLVNFNGDFISMDSHRYRNFKYTGTTCVKCGLEGLYFYKERFYNDKTYHFNLYGINKRGEEELMTRDHIIPKSQGGLDKLKNSQTLCQTCNGKKGSMDNNKFMKKHNKGA